MRTILLFSLIFIASCSTPVKKQEKMVNKNFESFLEKFKNTDLPLVIKACRISDFGSVRLDGADTMFIKEISGRIPYCTFKPNGNYTAVISLGMADCSLPILTTFDSNGKKIDEQDIAIGKCGVGPGFSCEEYMTLRKDYTLYTSDTISESEVDSLSNEIPGTEEEYVLYKKGRLLSSGKIELTEELKKELRKPDSTR